MPDPALSRFLATTPFADWSRTELAGDASARRYTRLSHGDETAILMQAGPQNRAETDTFLRLATWLRDAGLCAPRALAHDRDSGIVVLEDLGPLDLAGATAAAPLDSGMLYTAAADVLVFLDGLTPPARLPVMTPQVAGEMLTITCEWYAGTAPELALSTAMADHVAALCTPPSHLALRDYHAENLIWRPDRTGMDRIGLLDFQDAFLAPRGYDLVSLIRDARRQIDETTAATATAHFAQGTGQSAAALSPALACLAVQRNLRILGVFARLAKRDGKTRYLTMVPHLWQMIEQDIAHPALTALRQVVFDILPPPAHSAIKDAR